MDTRRHPGDLLHSSVEGIRDHEVRRLFGKLSLSPEQREAVENLSCSLVEELLIHGPIAERIDLIQELREKRGRQGA
jgi:hypothetical protein